MSVLEMKGVSLGFGDRFSIRGLDLEVEAGARVAFFGPSGGGKRTCLKLAAGALSADQGAVRLQGRGRPAPVGFVSNEGGLVNNLTLAQNVALPLVYHRLSPLDEALAKARALMGELGVGAQSERRPAQASVAAKRLAQMSRALLVEPALFVLEDPLDDVDGATGKTVREVLARIRAREESAAIVSVGSLAPYIDWATAFVLFKDGEARRFGSRKELEGAGAKVREFF